MMRSLWTAASGMTAQQLNVDTIANNLANVNTTGYKKERVEFKTLLYDTLDRTTLDAGVDTQKPVNLQVGHGVRSVATSRVSTPGGQEKTDNPLDFFIEGEGFFSVKKGDQTLYSRDGNFKVSIDGDTATLVTSQGDQILNTDGNPVQFPSSVSTDSLIVNPEGSLYYVDNKHATIDLNTKIDLVQFPNFQGLEAVGSNLYTQTAASGDPVQESSGDTNTKSSLIQGFLELSNVQIADEMVKLIVAQRAYELNSKAITTSDDMLQTANNLKR